MKKSYKKLLFLEIILFSFLLVNSYFPKLLHGYFFILFLIVLLIVTKLLFGFEKVNKRYINDTLIYITVFLVSFFVLFYLVGALTSFTKSFNYFTKNGVLYFILPAFITIIIKEIIRFNLIKKCEDTKLLMILTILLFVMLDLVNVVNFKSFYSAYNTFLVVALYIIPAISKNILCSYLSSKTGYIPPIMYLLVMDTYKYFVPIVPNVNNYIYSLIGIIFPLALFFFLFNLFNKENDEFVYRNDIKTTYGYLIVAVIIMIPIVYLSCGYFRYYSLVIGSGSMEPNIHTGNAVIIDTHDKDIEIGDVIVYKYSDKIVVHRLNKIIETKKGNYYYTKGDANKNIDTWVVTDDMLVGTVKVNIPYIGLPVVWLNNL